VKYQISEASNDKVHSYFLPRTLLPNNYPNLISVLSEVSQAPSLLFRRVLSTPEQSASENTRRNVIPPWLCSHAGSNIAPKGKRTPERDCSSHKLAA